MRMGRVMISLTWDEYLAQMSNYLVALRQLAQVGSTSPVGPPARPTDPIPEECREEAGRLSDLCDQVVAEVSARMTVIAARLPSARQSPHQESRVASYLETDM